MRRRLLATILGVAVMISLLPAVMAYEAHIVNVTSLVREPFNIAKQVRLATNTIIDPQTGEPIIGEIEANWAKIAPTIGADPAVYDPYKCNYQPNSQPPVPLTDPYTVPVETCVVWLVSIPASNPYSYFINNVIVTDNFSAEMAGQPLDTMPVDLFIKFHSRGRSGKTTFPTQYRITWYVTCDLLTWNPETEPPCGDNSGSMAPGAAESLEMLVWTKLNPSGRQEYTTEGTYTLNSGPTMKWLDPDGHQFSSEAPPVPVYVVAQ